MARLFNRLAIRELARMQVASYSNRKDHWVSTFHCASQSL